MASLIRFGIRVPNAVIRDGKEISFCFCECLMIGESADYMTSQFNFCRKGRGGGGGGFVCASNVILLSCGGGGGGGYSKVSQNEDEAKRCKMEKLESAALCDRMKINWVGLSRRRGEGFYTDPL